MNKKIEKFAEKIRITSKKSAEKFHETRLSGKNTPKVWKRIRNIAAIVASIGGIALAAPVSIPAGIAAWISYIALVSGTIAGTSHLTKK
jgi:hypothetical protein